MSKIELPNIQFNSELVSNAFRLERLRGELGNGTTPPAILSELHNLFQFLMSMVSARIEGNRTTVRAAVSELQQSTDDGATSTDHVREIANIQEAMSYIDFLPTHEPMTHKLLRELHYQAVDGLSREGDPTPGQYRAIDVAISQAAHRPVSHVLLMPELDDLLEFINREMQPQDQLNHVAIAHHRLVWVHPFRNGNGRVSRLLSYYMLRRHGFVSPAGMRTVNPAAVFGSDRNSYMSALAVADDLSNSGQIAWCDFFMQGMLTDLQRLVRFQDFDLVKSELLLPALDNFQSSGRITARQREALVRTISLETAKASDLQDILEGAPSQRSHEIRSLIDRGLLTPVAEGARRYRVSFAPNEFTNFIVDRLDKLGYLPPMLRD